ncbi:hypothetical protein SAMN05880566_12271 [Janthinobacterium sp. TND4EL3]|nr:hypothetical protein [Janthinobacterium sp. TND4EL3]SIR79813.1 hypothetical protein SAMN05880566_12271 [Janthinobacterium sp. TND4EL3]
MQYEADTVLFPHRHLTENVNSGEVTAWTRSAGQNQAPAIMVFTWQ